MQLASRIRSEDLDEFFSAVGKVAEVRLVTDRKRKSKGIAYVEFVDVESVPLAIALTGQKLLGVPIVVQMSHAEKNRLAAMQAAAAAAAREAGGGTPGAASGFIPGAAKLYVGSLHYNISEDMLRAIFEPFGKLLDVSIVKDQKTGQSQGFAFLTFRNAEDASVALVQMNGFPLAGRPLKVGRSERSACFPDVSEIDKLGTLLASSSAASSEALSAATAAASLIGSLPQLQDPLAGMPVGLMAPGLMPGIGQDLTASLGMGSIPGLGLNTTTSALGLGMSQGMSMAFAPPPALAAPPVTAAAPPISTDCLLVSNLFDPNKQMAPGWDASLSDDIVRECARHNAAVTHIAVDRASAQGNVYVKCESVTAALAAVTALHGRYFDGRLVTVAYVPTEIYHSLFPGAALQAPAAASTALASAGLSSGMPGAV
jgi:RNA-binding protein 39